MEDDYMQLGETGLVGRSDGTYINVLTREIYSAEGELIGREIDPQEED